MIPCIVATARIGTITPVPLYRQLPSSDITMDDLLRMVPIKALHVLCRELNSNTHTCCTANSLLLRLLLLILLVPLLMRGLLLSLMPRLILLLLRLMHGLLLSLMPWLMLRLPLIRQATFTVALTASAAIVASTSPAPPATSDFEISGQGMAAVGPVRAPVKLLHANETTHQLG